MATPKKEHLKANAVGGGQFSRGTAAKRKATSKGKRYNVPASRRWATLKLTKLMLAGDLNSFWIPSKDQWNIKHEANMAWTPYTWVQMEEYLNDREPTAPTTSPRKRGRRK